MAKAAPKKAKAKAAPKPKYPKKPLEERKARVDWLAVKLRYVHGEPSPDGGMVYPSLAALAASTGIPLRTIEMHSRDEDWPGARKKHQESIEDAQNSEAIRLMVRQRARVRTAFFQTGMRVQQSVNRKLANGDDPSAMDLLRLSSSLQTSQNIVDRAMGFAHGDTPDASFGVEGDVDWTLWSKPAPEVIEAHAELDAAETYTGVVIAPKGSRNA